MLKVSFSGKPNKYLVIDNVVSRSAQPQKDDFSWLKEQGVTDIINFRTKPDYSLDFNEQNVVEKLGMKYHNIPSYTRNPQKEKLEAFLDIIQKIAEKNGKVHIHCKAGVDRTGMYSFIYKQIKNIGATQENINEWINLGHHQKLFPDLIEKTQELLKKIK